MLTLNNSISGSLKDKVGKVELLGHLIAPSKYLRIVRRQDITLYLPLDDQQKKGAINGTLSGRYE